MNSALNIIKIILLSIIAIALVFILVVLLNGKMNIKGFTLYEKTELVYEKDFTEEINNLKVITINNDVRIEESESDHINVKVYDRKDAKPEAYVENDTLVIKNKNDIRIGFSFGINGSSKIVITVPKNTTYNLDIEGTSSDVDSLISLKDVNINLVSGDINLKDSLDTIIKTTSGDVDINSVNSKLTIEVISGDININKVNLTKTSTIKTISGDVTIGTTNRIYVDAHTVSGDIKVNTNDRKSDYELKINTTSGDIRVNN